jgi:phosphomannomutase
MNLAVVLRTAAGLAHDLLQRTPRFDSATVVVGYDARRNSRKYAEAFVGVLVAAGLGVRYFQTPEPTPLVAYAARRLGALAAVCVTASHNPAEYAGLKVFADNAVQIAAPRDAEIASAIAVQGPADSIACCDEVELQSSPLARVIDEDLVERYYDEVLAVRHTSSAPYPLNIVYTPLHGVGGLHMTELLDRAGYWNVRSVPEQFQPDPQFPTVRFPNPEEPGTLALAIALARSVEADLVLANDPDADRLAVAASEAGGFRLLTGNQVGLLLTNYLLEHSHAKRPRFVVSSIVSSPMLEHIARHHGVLVYRTLTGFKWMLNAALAIERDQGKHFVFGFEEALGYAVRGPVLDKDGLSAGLVFADLVGEGLRVGRTVPELLAGLYARHGLWVSCPRNVSLKDTAAAENARAQLKQLAQNPPSSLAGLEVELVIDYASNVSARPWYLGYADMLEFRLRGGSRVIVRPSGTEPKLKIYADFVQALSTQEPVREQERAAEVRAEQLAQSLEQVLTSV